MTPTPLFSILIANYNNGKYLMEAIESVRQQTYPHWEIILVDDASTDNSRDLYRDLEKDERIHIYYNDVNHGCGYTKRRCAELANGEICGFLDPDDALTPDALNVMAAKHFEHPSASLIYSHLSYCDSALKQISVSTHQCEIPKGKTFLEIGYGAISQFAVFKKRYYDMTIGLSEHNHRAVDQDLYFLLEEAGETIHIPDVLYKYRTNTGNNISLGENGFKAACWKAIVAAEACKRRNVPIEDYAFLELYAAVEGMCKEAEQKGAKSVREAKSYRLGHFLLTPIFWVRDVFRKFNIHSNSK